MLPLKGKKVLSFETWGAGAYHAELLAFLGAEVINVEDPRQSGNPLRTMGPVYLDPERSDNEGNEFCMHNKLSMALDIRTEKGQEVFCLTYQAMWYLDDSILKGKQPRSAHASQAPSQIYKTANGWIYVACLTQKFWELLCKELEHQELLEDARFKTNDDRMKNRDTMTEILDGIFSQHPTSYWCEKLQGMVPCAPVLNVKESLDNEYIRKSEKIIAVPYEDNPSRREVYFIAPPFSFEGIPGVKYKLAPRLGEHTDEIPKSLGYRSDEIDMLRNEKVIL
jgi:crotonobetainyl-CoA:carnitine CoA-transferase CaiB-like acyl-CoA transferase